MKSNFDTRFVLLYSMENITIKIKDESISIKRSERKHLSQDLNKVEVERMVNVKIAKGEIRINTFKRIYLMEYRNIKLRKPIETTVFIIPSIEKTFAEFPSTLMIASEILTNLEKHMSVCKNFPPYFSYSSRYK